MLGSPRDSPILNGSACRRLKQKFLALNKILDPLLELLSEAGYLVEGLCVEIHVGITKPRDPHVFLPRVTWAGVIL